MKLSRTVGAVAVLLRHVVGKTFIVNMGVTGHKVQPQMTDASVGDTIRFTMFPTGHSVARAYYKQPCIPIDWSMPQLKIQSFWQPFTEVENEANSEDYPYMDVKVNDTEPIWFYCSVPSSCSDGMVGVVWVNDTRKEADKQEMYQGHWEIANATAPAEVFGPNMENPKGEGAHDSNEDASSGPADEPQSSGGISKGAIAGIVVGALAGLGLLAGLIYCWGRNRSLMDVLKYSRPPSGRIAPLPGSQQETAQVSQPPYSPAPPYAPVADHTQDNKYIPTPLASPYMPTPNAHESWMSVPTVGGGSPISQDPQTQWGGPTAFTPSYQPVSPPIGHHTYQDGQPWSAGVYGHSRAPDGVVQMQEMGAGQEAEAATRQSRTNSGFPGIGNEAWPAEMDADVTGGATVRHQTKFTEGSELGGNSVVTSEENK